jgi:16S rRNA (cytidine1402-2'-O)-methyltransferase
MIGKLVLVPTPIDEESPLETMAFNRLKESSQETSFIVVEELKEVRRRWLRWGLPRERVEHFIEYNEHNQKEKIPELIQLLKSGKTLFLMSDCGLPAFCDPGTELVSRCHDEKIQVTSTPFANSISLALALSGFNHSRFVFEGFLPKETSERELVLKRILKMKETTILMDTPYRLDRLLSEIKKIGTEVNQKRPIFLGLDLNHKSEELLRGPIDVLLKKVEGQKREFILILG